MGADTSAHHKDAVPQLTANGKWIRLGERLIHVSAIAFINQQPDKSLEIRMLGNSSLRANPHSTPARGTDAFTTRPLTPEELATFWAQLTGEAYSTTQADDGDSTSCVADAV